MLNAEKFKKEIERLGYDFALTKNKEFIFCGKCSNCIFDKSSPTCTCAKFKWLLEEYKEPILDDIEKEYLSAVIKPFRKRIKSIEKSKYTRDIVFIIIAMDKCEHIFLPCFSLYSGMYKGMEINKEYTLKELGLC